jgi:hypothetical protein
VIINGQKGAPRNCRYVYAHFSTFGLGFAARNLDLSGVGLVGYPASPDADPIDFLLNPDPEGTAGVIDTLTSEGAHPGSSLMYPWGYPRYWTGKIDGEFDSVYASAPSVPSSADSVYYHGEVVHSVSYSNHVIKAVGLYQAPRNPDDTRPLEEQEKKTMIFMALVNSAYLWDGFQYCYDILAQTLEGWSVDPETKVARKLWGKSFEEVGWWYGLTSVSPDGTKVATVANITSPSPGVAIVELDTMTGAIRRKDVSAIAWDGEFTTTTEESSDGTVRSKTIAVYIDCPGSPPGWGTVQDLHERVTNFDRSITTTFAPGGAFGVWLPWACQYDDDDAQTLLIARARHSGTYSATLGLQSHAEEAADWTYSPCVSLGLDVVGSSTHDTQFLYSWSRTTELKLPDGTIIPMQSLEVVEDSSFSVATQSESHVAPGGSTPTGSSSASDSGTIATSEHTVSSLVIALDLRSKFMAFYSMEQLIEFNSAGAGSGSWTSSEQESYSSSRSGPYTHQLKGSVSRYVNGALVPGLVATINRPSETISTSSSLTVGGHVISGYFFTLGSVPDVGPQSGNSDITLPTGSTPDPVVEVVSAAHPVPSAYGYFAEGAYHTSRRLYNYQLWSPWHLATNIHALSYNGVVMSACPKFEGIEGLTFIFPQWAGREVPEKYHGGLTDLEYNVRCYTTRDVNGLSSEVYRGAVDASLSTPVEDIPYVFQVRPVQYE